VSTFSRIMENPHDFRISLTKEELDLLRRFKAKHILEVFCGDARNLVALSKLGYQVVGVEENKELLEKASDRINVIEHPVFEEPLPFAGQRFDAVYSWQYINHNFKNKIERVFEEIYRVLKRGGLFSIKVSDFEQLNFKKIGDNIYEEQDLEFGKMKYKMIASQTFIKLSGKEKDIPHYAFYKKELEQVLEKIGFIVINARKIKWNIVANFKKE